MTDTQTVVERLPPQLADKIVSGGAAERRSSLTMGVAAMLGGVGYGVWALLNHEGAINQVVALGGVLVGAYLFWSTRRSPSAVEPLRQPGNRLVWIYLTHEEEGTSLTTQLTLATSSGAEVEVVLGTSPGAVTDALYAARQSMKQAAEATLASLAELFPEAAVGHSAEREKQYQSDPASLANRPPYRWIALSASNGELLEQVRAQARQACAQGLKPLAYGTATWAGPAQLVKTLVQDPEVAKVFHGRWVMEIDVDDFPAEQIIAVYPELKVVPLFLAVDADGLPTGPRIDNSAWQDDTPASMAKALSAFLAKA